MVCGKVSMLRFPPDRRDDIIGLAAFVYGARIGTSHGSARRIYRLCQSDRTYRIQVITPAEILPIRGKNSSSGLQNTPRGLKWNEG